MQYRDKLNKSKGSLHLLKKQLAEKEEKLKKVSKRTVAIEEAQTIIQITAKETQENLRYHIEDVVQLALDCCFPDRYEFIVNFTIKRGRTEADLSLLDENGVKVNPMDAAGGGVVDIVSFALRIALWSLSKNENVIILDEPFKFLSKDLIPKGAEIIKELSEKMNIQFIIVTHIPELAELSNTVYNVLLKDGISIVKKQETT